MFFSIAAPAHEIKREDGFGKTSNPSCITIKGQTELKHDCIACLVDGFSESGSKRRLDERKVLPVSMKHGAELIITDAVIIVQINFVKRRTIDSSLESRL